MSAEVAPLPTGTRPTRHDLRRHTPRGGVPALTATLWIALLPPFPSTALARTWDEDRRADAPASSGTDRIPAELHLDVGDQKVISAEGVKSYSEGKRGVVDVRLTRDAQRFVVVGLHPGLTSLLFLLTDGSEKLVRITVSDPSDATGRTSHDAAARAADEERETTVERRENVRLDFYFVQLEKGSTRRIGVGTPGAVTAGLRVDVDLTRGALQGASAIVEDQALLRLDLAQSAGWAKLLRQATVITQSGAKARFSGGGEVNIVVQGALATGIHRIAFGSSIEVLPRYDATSGRIEIELRADVSDLSDAHGSGTPGRTVSELTTVVNLGLGQAVVLGGLSARGEAHSRSGLPWLSQIPVLGILFGSDHVTRRETENVVVIVPTVVDTVDAEVRTYLHEALDSYKEYSGAREALETFAARRRAAVDRGGVPGAGLESSAGARLKGERRRSSRTEARP